MVYGWCNLIFGNQFTIKFPPLGWTGGGKRRGWPLIAAQPMWVGLVL